MQGRVDLLVLLPHIEHDTLRGGRRHATALHRRPKVGHGRAAQHTLIQYVILLVTRERHREREEEREREICLVVLRGEFAIDVGYDFYSRLHVGRKVIVKLERGRGHLLAVQQKGRGTLQLRRVSLMAIEALQTQRVGEGEREGDC